MPNHFHLLIKQNQEGGLTEFMSKLLNSYTKYYNTKHKRVGPLLQGTFKAVPIESDEQLMHVSRYIHLNPYTSEITQSLADLENYPYSSYSNYLETENSQLCVKEPVLDFFSSPAQYKEFVADHGDYSKELEIIKHILLDTDTE